MLLGNNNGHMKILARVWRNTTIASNANPFSSLLHFSRKFSNQLVYMISIVYVYIQNDVDKKNCEKSDLGTPAGHNVLEGTFII